MFHMQRQRRLPEEHARFYAAEICLALNFLHEKGAILEVILDQNWEIITDFMVLPSVVKKYFQNPLHLTSVLLILDIHIIVHIFISLAR